MGVRVGRARRLRGTPGLTAPWERHSSRKREIGEASGQDQEGTRVRRSGRQAGVFGRAGSQGAEPAAGPDRWPAPWARRPWPDDRLVPLLYQQGLRKGHGSPQGQARVRDPCGLRLSGASRVALQKQRRARRLMLRALDRPDHHDPSRRPHASTADGDAGCCLDYGPVPAPSPPGPRGGPGSSG